MNNTNKCRWGIMSAAGIARKNWRAIALSKNGQVQAVAARKKEAAANFIGECRADTSVDHVPDAIEGYEGLLLRSDIDAVYIPLPTGVRGPWIRRALEAGKHVLAEKPVGVDAKEVQSLVELADSKQLQFMDGVMFMHSKRLQAMKAVLDNGSLVGKLKRLAIHFSFRGDEEFCRSNIRSMSQFEPHGCLGDLGWYCLRFILWSQNYRLPKSVTARTLQSIQGEGSPKRVPGELSGEIFYEDGFSASFYCSFLTENQQWAHLSGDQGSLWVDDFVLPFYGSETVFQSYQPRFSVEGCNFHMHPRKRQYCLEEYSDGHDNAQEIELFRNFANNVLSRNIQSEWGQISLKTQQVMDAAMKSASVDGAAVTL
jgi:predicted dehydrogenase